MNQYLPDDFTVETLRNRTYLEYTKNQDNFYKVGTVYILDLINKAIANGKTYIILTRPNKYIKIIEELGNSDRGFKYTITGGNCGGYTKPQQHKLSWK